MNLRRLFAVAFAFLAIVTLNAQVVNPVKWSQKIGMTSRDEGVMTFTANIENHWHIYGLDLPDGGPRPTKFDFKEVAGAEVGS